MSKHTGKRYNNVGRLLYTDSETQTVKKSKFTVGELVDYTVDDKSSGETIQIKDRGTITAIDYYKNYGTFAYLVTSMHPDGDKTGMGTQNVYESNMSIANEEWHDITNAEHLQYIFDELKQMYNKKNKEYGNSAYELYDKAGAITLAGQIFHKANRGVTVVQTKESINYESARDTFIDLMLYAAMTVYKLDEEEAQDE